MTMAVWRAWHLFAPSPRSRETDDYGGMACLAPFHGGDGLSCTDEQWQLYIANTLRRYNGVTDGAPSEYPEEVYSHLTSPIDIDGAFGGNLPYADPGP